MTPKTFYPFALGGRLGRRRFAAYLAAWTVLILGAGALVDRVILGPSQPLPPFEARPSFLPTLIVHPAVHVALSWRRFHDIGARGGWGLLALSVPLGTFAYPYAWAVALASLGVLAFTLTWPGDRGANAYGTRASRRPPEA